MDTTSPLPTAPISATPHVIDVPAWANRSPARRYDLVVLGEDPAGICAAREAARLGKRVALAVRDAGDCAHPSRAWAVDSALRQAGRVAARLAGSTAGGQLGAGQVDFHAVMDWVGRITTRLSASHSLAQLAEAGIDVFVGRAAFGGPAVVSVDCGELRFRRAVIAAGACPVASSLPGADEAECLTAEALASLRELPRRLAVLGTGPRACQWAQTFCRLGSDVYLIDSGPEILPGEPPEVVRLIRRRLESDGVHVDLGCQGLEVQRTGNQRVLVIQRDDRKEKLFVEQILPDTPSRPRLEGLSLEAAGVRWTPQGVAVDDQLRTSNRHIFAAGAVCGPRFAGPEAAEATGRLAVHNALCLCPWRRRRLSVPRWIGTDPEIAQLGLTPGEAAGADIEIDTHWAELAETDRAVLEGREDGFVLAHVERSTGRLVGACIVGEGAGELLGPLSIVMARNLTLAALAEVVPCRPSGFEVLHRLGRRWSEGRRPSRWSAALAAIRRAWRRR